MIKMNLLQCEVAQVITEGCLEEYTVTNWHYGHFGKFIAGVQIMMRESDDYDLKKFRAMGQIEGVVIFEAKTEQELDKYLTRFDIQLGDIDDGQRVELTERGEMLLSSFPKLSDEMPFLGELWS